MAKALYTGVGDKAQKVKGIYIGVDGKARKVKKAYIGVDGKARLFYSGEWVLGAEVVTATATGQTAAISGYDTYSFNADAGILALTGSKTSHALSSLLSSKKPVYTAVSSDGHTITLKRVTDSATTTTDAYYTEGSLSSTTSSGNSASSTLSGKSSYTFDKTTGQYTISGSRSGNLATLYNNGYTVYTSGGTSLVYKKVTDQATDTITTYSEGSFSVIDSYNDSDLITTYSGYTGYDFDPSTGTYSGTGLNQQISLWEGESVYAILYQPNGSYCERTTIEYSGWLSAQITIERATARRSTSTATTYTITTFTKGRKYVAATSDTTYTVQTLTQTATE